MGKMRQRRGRFLCALAVLTAAWLLIIFVFSAQASAESSRVSGGVSYRFVAVLNRIFHLGQSDEELLAAALRMEHPVRKCAHMGEYAILSLMIFGLLVCFRWRAAVSCYVLALLFTFLYACTDEYHQRFVPGRSGSFSDVMIDTAGAAAAMLFLFLLVTVTGKVKRHRRTRDMDRLGKYGKR